MTRILIVEDYLDTREIIKAILKNQGYSVIEAETGQEGLEKAIAELPDLIIMDIMLPGMDGIETTIKLKQHPKTANIPVIANTIWKERDFQDRAEKAGIVEYLIKPTAPLVFKEIIERTLKATRYN